VGIWSWLWGNGSDATPNANTAGVAPASVAAPDYSPGDPDGVVFDNEPTFHRSLPFVQPAPWDGWPAEWGVPHWDFQSRFNELVDIAWACLDLNASVLSTMPVYKTKGGVVVEPSTWMLNPDPTIYTSWHEFAKQLFWDYMLGEAFVLPVATGSDGWPLTFRVMPPWSVDVQMSGGRRVYRLGGVTGPDVTDEILHIRYKSSTDQPRGTGPLEIAGARMVTAGVLARYVRNMAVTGGVVAQTLESDQPINNAKAQELVDRWMESRVANLGAPPVFGSGLKLVDHMQMSPTDMAMLEISQVTEARIAVLLGVPPFLVGLPSGGNSMTYSNVESLFDFHDRSSLRPKASNVMAALSGWSLPRGSNAELNRDEYSRPALAERANAWATLHGIDVLSPEEIRAIERLPGSLAANVAPRSGNDAAEARNLAEMVQKIYLGVGVVLSADEARQIINQAGGDLPTGFTPTPVPAPALTGGEV
jgi:phage portal protein BeeE